MPTKKNITKRTKRTEDNRSVYEKRFNYKNIVVNWEEEHPNIIDIRKTGVEYATLQTIRNFRKVLNYILDNWDTVNENGFTAKQAGVTGATMSYTIDYSHKVFNWEMFIERSEPKTYVNVDDPNDKITLRRTVRKAKYYPCYSYEEYADCLKTINAELAKEF